ncbi:hypothetical protein DM02DRAFT_634819 [Periconia macrospinosa]|uniref:Pyruvate dehydrogenase protein x component n=1 Tax=Periconia macrospinosa TaxID=97972 RepID=A0A2V1D4Z2_9PLEO|nr:hypothetical protein DM02DRAFT_634819 [Periconia macrospinosa]
MPALSPTMTEGNIASWRVKEGDSFVAGDVLLEIETDKAQMDVEAQDDGILAKIIQGDGSKAVQVGTRIAVTAEPGDDLASLEIPTEDTSASPKKEAPKEQPRQESATAPKSEGSGSSSKPAFSSGAPKASAGKARKQTYPLYPSVQHLMKEAGLPKEEADKIPATGPNGRLLKGDVLAYIGKIQESYASEVAERLKKLSHLDLSNIKVAAPKEKAPAKATPEVKEAPAAIEEPPVELALSISLKAVYDCQKRVQESIGVFLPVSTFIARATELANDNLPRSQVLKPSADELFNAVLGLDKVAGKSSRGSFVPHVTALPPISLRATPAPKKSDILDLLVGKKPATAKSSPLSSTPKVIGPVNELSISVPKGDERRGRVFLERMKIMLEAEPGRLVV